MDSRNLFGGQAVIEGVMMRGAGRIATAVRRPDGSIHVSVRPYRAYAERHRWLGWPVVRGAAALVEALVIGIQALNESARIAEGEEPAPAGPRRVSTATAGRPGARPGDAAGRGPAGSSGDRWLAWINAAALLGGVLLFVLLPTWAATWLARGDLARNLVEGGVRLALLLGYMAAIGRIPDIQRVYQYHGAEHKAIHALEAGAPLTPESARRFSRFHPRCGTAFLLFVAVVAVVVHAFFGWPGVWVRTALRLSLVPVVAGLAFEWIRLAGRSPSRWVAWLSAPGLWLQRLTTAEPSDDQLEVALAALRACLGEHPVAQADGAAARTPPPGAAAAAEPVPAATPTPSTAAGSHGAPGATREVSGHA